MIKDFDDNKKQEYKNEFENSIEEINIDNF